MSPPSYPPQGGVGSSYTLHSLPRRLHGVFMEVYAGLYVAIGPMWVVDRSS